MSTTQVKGLPSGWFWMYKGEESYINSRGEKSDARHVTNIQTGQRMSAKQAQKLQRQALEQKEQQVRETPVKREKKKTIPREGMIFKKKGKSRKGNDTISYYFRSLGELREFTESQGIDSSYKQYLVQIKYSSKNKNKKKDFADIFPDSNPNSGKGYATLSPYTRSEEGFNEEDWIDIYQKAEMFTQNSATRYIIYATS